MKVAFAVLLALHGAIHLLGFVKGFGLAEVAQLRAPISRRAGALWLVAALALFVTASLLFAAPRVWWAAGLPALLLSQCLVFSAWRDARFGTLPNVVLLLPLALALLDLRPSSLRSRYDAEVRASLAHAAQVLPPPVTEAELAPLPPLVQAYLRRVGVVGKPHVRDFHATFRVRFRMAPDAPWMDATAEQVNTFDPPSRVFFMQASRAGLPFDGLHRYVGRHATFEVRALGLFPVVDARGPEMDQSETVTMLNDICLLAPAVLVDGAVTFEPAGERSLRATFTNAGHTVHAELRFDARGDLVDFVSHDRYANDGRTSRLLPWSTPVHEVAETSGFRLFKKGDALWHEPSGAWSYGEFELLDVAYDLGARR